MIMARKHVRRDEVKEYQWRERLAGWRGSGQSIGAYCRELGLSEQQFYYWRARLRQEAGAASSPPERSGPSARHGAVTTGAVSFVEVPRDQRLSSGLVTTAVVTVVVPSGWRVEVGPGFDGATLREVLTVVASVG
jgi:transposase-like protein